MLHRDSNHIIIAFLLDLLSIILAASFAYWFRLNLPYGHKVTEVSGWNILLTEAFFIYLLIFLLFNLYDPDHTYRLLDEYQLLTGACLVAALALAGIIYFTARDISRLILVYFYIIHFCLTISWRGVARLARISQNGRARDQHRVLLIGGGEPALQLFDRLQKLSWAGVQLVGYLTDGEPIPAANGGFSFLGNLNKIDKVVEEYAVDDILIALPAESYQKIYHLMPHLVDQPCNIWVVPDYFSLLIYGARVVELGEIPMISIKAPTMSGYQRVVKRVFDLIFGSFFLILASPLMALIAIAISLDSSGKVIFKQYRVGENGKLFRMYKFRSMVVDADRRFSEVMQQDANGNTIHKLPNDPRVTRVGRFIRRTSLDELPNLFNVLKGEMSLVGPRPELPIFVEQYEQWQRKRLAVPQGITGWWQVNGRSDKPMHLHTEDDLYYVQNYSLLLDIAILLKTVGAVLRRKGAY
jgi:exopolysaccharide biosynthesis polyprenyl glycosylphosphotransferase